MWMEQVADSKKPLTLTLPAFAPSLRQVHGQHQCGGHNPLHTFGLGYFLGPIAAYYVSKGNKRVSISDPHF